METLVRVHRKSLRTLILERALVVWQIVWASLIPPAKIRVLTPPWIISFEVWRIEGLPLVIKSISLLYLDCSFDLKKVRAVNS